MVSLLKILRLRRHFKVKIFITELHLVWTGGQGGVSQLCKRSMNCFFYTLDSFHIKMTQSKMASLALG